MMIMSGLGPALAVEAAKFRRARVPVTTTAMLVGGVALMCVAMLLAVRAGDPTTVAKFGPTVARGDGPACSRPRPRSPLSAGCSASVWWSDGASVASSPTAR